MTTKLSVTVRTDIGRVRKTNEDAFLFADLEKGRFESRAAVERFEVSPRGAVLAVSDGMGGHKAGEVASALTLEALYKSLTQNAPRGEADNRIKEAVVKANQEVVAAGKRPSLANMGATLTAVLVDGGDAYIAEVGDSRAYLLRNGELRQLTEDQSFVQAMVKAGGMSPEEAAASSWRNVILQAIGHESNLKVALGKLALRQRDLLILCSDGLTSLVSDDDLRAEILATTTLDDACDRLVALANERGGTDNITVLLAGVNGDLPAVQREERISDTYNTLERFSSPRVVRGAS
jgi:serine/threonine protein phosphatase PrpC